MLDKYSLMIVIDKKNKVCLCMQYVFVVELCSILNYKFLEMEDFIVCIFVLFLIYCDKLINIKLIYCVFIKLEMNL